MPVALLGTGLLGAGFVEALRRNGHDVHVWNRTGAKARALEALGAVAFDDPAEACRGAARVHLVLSDDDAVMSVLDAAGPGIADGTPVIDHTTTSVQGAADRTARYARWPYVHAPVFMGPDNARDAKGLMLISGDPDIEARVRPALEAMTSKVWYVGARPDLAAAYKLFGNAMFFAILGGLTDVFRMGQALGIDAPTVMGLFSVLKPGGMIDARGGRAARGEFHPASFELAMARKDIRLMIDAAGGPEALAVLPGVAELMDGYLARGEGLADFSVIAKDAVAPLR